MIRSEDRVPRLMIVSAGLAIMLAATALAEGDLGLKPQRLAVLEIGLGEAGFGVSQTDFALSTGKAYALKIKSTGRHACAWTAPDFFNFAWLRKVEVNKVEIKASHLYEIEMEREGEAEVFFVPIRPGEYDWRCRGLEGRGLAGRFIVK
jgi:hypothetical protein